MDEKTKPSEVYMIILTIYTLDKDNNNFDRITNEIELLGEDVVPT